MNVTLTLNFIKLAAGTSLSLALTGAVTALPVAIDSTHLKSVPIVLAQAERPAANAGEQPKNLKNFLKKKQREAGSVENAGNAAAQETKPDEAPASAETVVQPAEPAPEPDILQPQEQKAAGQDRPEPREPAPVETTNNKPEAMPEPVVIGSEKPGIEKQPAEPAVGTGKKPKSRDLRKFLKQGESENAKSAEPVSPSGGPEVARPAELAPLTDSAKELMSRGNNHGSSGTGATPPADGGSTANPVVGMEAPPETDALAQPDISIGRIESVEAEQGQRRRERRRPESRRSDENVVGIFGNRLVIRLDSGGLSIVDEDDRDRRLHRRARDVYVEELRGGRTRETVIRPNGVRIVTIYNRYGDVIRRSRITPDGRETVLVYVPRDRWDDMRGRDYDVGAELPPLRLSIPRREYILEAERASREDYYRFLNRPPVETVERLYSIDEVRRSARIRDKIRRIDMNTITFASGSAAISESEIDNLQLLGDAISRLLDENPAETFLIEGHTDAVGSEASNMVLSDQRAESVAEVLTDFFGIPPENLVTQGYGERYLKINTLESERQNRRVAVRRITALISPVNLQVRN